MIIRKATKKDIKNLQELCFLLFKKFEKLDKMDKLDLSYWSTKKQHKDFRKLLKRKDYIFYVAEENKKIVGYIEGSIFRNYPIFKIKRKGHIECLFIKPEYREKGIADKLVKTLLKWFKTRKIKYFTLTTQAKDKEAINFWKKYGFKEYNIKFKK